MLLCEIKVVTTPRTSLLVVGGQWEHVYVWDYTQNLCIQTIAVEDVEDVAFDPTSFKIFVLLSRDVRSMDVKVYELSEETLVRGEVLFTESKTINCGKGSFLLSLLLAVKARVWGTLSERGAVQLYDIEGYQNIKTVPGFSVFSCNKCATVVATGSADTTAILWEGERCLYIFKGHTSQVCSVTMTGNYLFTGSVDGMVKVWDLNSKECLHTLST